MMGGIHFAWIIPLLLGWTVLSLAWRSPKGILEKMLKAILALFLGLGLTSALYFILGSVKKSPMVLFGCEIMITCFLGIVLFWSSSRCRDVTGLTKFVSPEKCSRFFFWTAGLLLLLALSGFYFLVLEKSFGDWDAQAIWNMRARFLFRDMDWMHVFEIGAWSHPDYPLLIPASLARAWEYLGYENFTGSSVLASFFTFGTALSLGLALHILGRSTGGALAFMLLMGTPFFMIQGSHQEADVPLSFCYLCVFILLFLAEKKALSRNHFLTLAGIFCGMAGWIKNEGILFLTTASCGILWGSNYFKKKEDPSFPRISFFVGMLPFLILLIGFKVFWAPANDLFVKQSLEGLLTQMTDLSRYVQITKIFAAHLWHFGHGALVALVLYATLVGFSGDREFYRSWKISRNILMMTFAGYFFVYVLTPQDLAWHLDKSLDRLLIQLWPSFIFLVMMVFRAQVSKGDTISRRILEDDNCIKVSLLQKS